MAAVAHRNIARSRPAESSQHEAYKIAHTARCKLHIAATRPDRDLRFVLGHAFTLDNLLIRIVEIENSSSQTSSSKLNDEEEFKPIEAPNTGTDKTAPEEHGVGAGAGVKAAETGSLARPPQQTERRVSFGNSANFKPSSIASPPDNDGNGKKGRARSPPPKPSSFPTGGEDQESSESEDDYDPTEFAEQLSRDQRPSTATQEEDDDGAAIDGYDDGDDGDDGLGLTRFASASAAPPRRPASPPPECNVPALEADEEDGEDEEDEGPVSPPQLPEDVARKMLVEGEVNEELNGLYNQIRRCTCGPDHEKAPKSEGMKTTVINGRRYGVIQVAA